MVALPPPSFEAVLPLLNGEVSFVTATPSLLAANEPPGPKAGIRDKTHYQPKQPRSAEVAPCELA